MSTTPSIRRSQRERKQTQPFASNPKRKRQDGSEDEDDDEDEIDPAADSDILSDEADEGDDEEPNFIDPRPAKRQLPKSKTSKAPVAKKPRLTVGKSNPRKNKITGTTNTAKDASISDDNPLFNAILNPSTAIQSTVQDFLESFESTPELALAQLINCVFRACGSNSSIDSDQVVDSDGVVELLGDLVEEMKSAEPQGYPLASKSPIFRKLRKSLAEFFDKLVSSAAEAEVLFESNLISTLQTWIVAMSSAQLRSFRHTATVVALEVESSLASVAAAIEKEAETIGRQREGERKRRKGGSKAGEREKALSAKAAEIKVQKEKMNEFLSEFFNGVFVHRYRDADAGIRADCVHEMGVWLKRHPAHFLGGDYLRYVGWVLSDTNTNVRLEAVKSLLSLYAKDDYIITLQHFTERFKSRLIRMATTDTELSVRVAVIQVLNAIDSHSLLEEEQREALCLLVFDPEAKVRKAVSSFVGGVWEETVSERLVGRRGGDKNREKELAGAKAIAALLVSWGQILERNGGYQEEETQSLTNDPNRTQRPHEIALLSGSQKSRLTLAVDALWDEVQAVKNWEALLELLLMDHSTETVAEAGPSSSAVKLRKKHKAAPTPRKAKEATVNNEESETVDEAWRLDEAEETVLVEVLLASLRNSLSEAASKKGSDISTVRAHMSRNLIEALPKLFAKHQTDGTRMSEILLIPQLMSLDLYLEMRMISAYEALWDDVTKQILTQTSSTVLGHALSTYSHLFSTTTLANTNVTKALELEEELSVALREAVSGKDELEVTTFSEDEINTLNAATLRLSMLFRNRDLSGWMEEDGSGKRSSAWDIISALVERGRLGRKEEETLIENSLSVLTLHITWKASQHRGEPSGSAGEKEALEALKTQRDSLLEKCTGLVGGDQSNATNGAKRSAFQSLTVLHVLFNRSAKPSALASLTLEMGDKLQYQCAGFIQGETERYADEILEMEAEANNDASDTVRADSDGEDDNDASSSEPSKKSKLVAAQRKTREETDEDSQLVSASHLENEHAFLSVVNYFLRAITASAIHARHSAVLFGYYGRLGSQFDNCLTTAVGVLREEGMFNNNGDTVVHVVTEVIRQAFTMFMEGQSDSPSHSIALAKALTPALAVRGAQLSIQRRLDSRYVVEIHVSSITWIVKRIAGYESSGNRKKKVDAIEFFRVLHALLSTIESREASKIKAHMEQALEGAKIEVPPTAKAWDAQRLYEKRLLGAMSRDKNIVAKVKVASKRKGKRQEDGEKDREDQSPHPQPRPRPRRSTRGAAATANDSAQEDENPVSEPNDTHAEEEEDVFGSKAVEPARPRPRPRRHFNEAVAGAPDDSRADVQPEEPTSSPVRSSPQRSPVKSPQKRSRPASEAEDADEDEDDEALIASLIDRQRANAQEKPSSQASHVSIADFQRPRKRARR